MSKVVLIYLDYNCFQRGFDDPRQIRIQKDAIHLACASYGKADFFLTCDDRLIRKAKQLKLRTVLMNPVDYVRQEVI